MKQSRDDNNGDDFAGYSSMRNRSSSRDNDNRKQQQTINNNCTEIQVNKSVDEVASQTTLFPLSRSIKVANRISRAQTPLLR